MLFALRQYIFLTLYQNNFTLNFIIQKVQQVNEGNLLHINGEVLEYKPPCNKESSEEIELELPEEEEEPCAASIRRLSLGDLGYGAVKGMLCLFIL